jgi:CYTH domain-containing protein
MPIENERKFVLDEDGRLEPALAATPGVTRSLLWQAYLDSSGLRIRSIETSNSLRHVFSYKRTVDGQMVEIETDIDRADFDRLWTLGREKLHKARYSWEDGRYHWDIDFFKTDEEQTYFALAEVEMPVQDTEPPPLPSQLKVRCLGLVPYGDPRFTSKRLADRAHAEALLGAIRNKGRIE